MLIRFHTNCNFVGCESQEEVEMPDDTTDKELDDDAWDRALETIQPEGWWEKVEGDNKEIDDAK